MILDVSSGTPSYTQVADSRFPHMTGQAVTLPTGDVLAVGGNSSGSDTKGTPVMTPELYSTASNSWSNMADTARRRSYHSVAALLPDGRVWSAGSSFDEIQEPNGQFFSPPYLFRKDGSGQLATRPTATNAPSSVAAGQSFSVSTSNPSNIAHASFIRLAATTHQVNMGQAFVKLNVTPGSGSVQMTAPSVDQAPPGYYMLFLVDQQGVPSVAPIMRFDKTAGQAPQPRATQSSQDSFSTRANNAFDGSTSSTTYAQTGTESQPWWQVDLGSSKDLATASITYRSGTSGNTGRDVWVFASDNPFNATTVAATQSQPGVTAVRLTTPTASSGTATLNKTARYVRVQAPGTSTSMSLAEVTLATTQKPTASITAPSAGATFTAPASYAINANASDPDGSVSKVEFYRGSTLVGTDTSAPYSVNDAGVGAGNYSLTAKAFDNNGATATSNPVNITVQPQNQQPAVSITAPSGGATFEAPASYTFSANASDADGQVSKVEFFRGTTSVGTDTSAPFSITDSNVGAGTYTLTAKATDNNNAETISAPVVVTVETPAPRTPVAAYAFDENSGPTLTDHTSNGHNGTINGASWAAAGHSGSALSFDGNNDMVSVADHNRLDLTNKFTIESWIKPRTLSGWRMVIMKEAPPNTLAYALYTSAGGGPIPSGWTTNGSVYGPNPINTGSWTHLATTYDSGTMRIYVNGTLAGTETGVPAAPATGGSLRIGGNAIWGNETFDGLIDDVRIYDRALTAAEVVTDRDTPVVPPAPPPTGPSPELKLDFDDGAGATAQDTSGNDLDGTLSASGATWSGAGHSGGAVDFNGSGTITVPDDSDLDLTSKMTLEAWVRPKTTATWQTVMMKEAPPWTLSYGMDATAQNMSSNAWVGGNGLYGPATPLNQWTHLAFTLDGGVGRLYRNGTLVSQASGMGSAAPTNGVLRIGGNSIWANEGFVGLIDEVRVWDEALSATDIAGHVAGASPAQGAAARKPACLVSRKAQDRRVKPGKCKRRR